MTTANDFLMGEPPEESDEEDHDPPWFTARFDGFCASCGGEIFGGVTEIRADGYNGWECC
jgi:hypothetical protein